MTESKRAIFALVSALMEYPDKDYFQSLPELLAEFQNLLNEADNAAVKKVIDNFINSLQKDGEQLSQEKYVALFDQHPDASLYLAWRRYGNDRGQGQAMAALNGLYRTAGFEPLPGVLPDYLPRVLAFFSLAEEWAIEACLDGFGPELHSLEESLKKINCPQAPLLSLALAPLRQKWPKHFKARSGPDPTVRPMARPEKEYAPLLGPYFTGSHKDTYIPD